LAQPPDPVSAIVAVLKADTDVAALISTKAYDRELPCTETENMPQKCVVVRPVGGSGTGDRTRVGEVNVDCMCYGEVPYQAAKVSWAVLQALKHMDGQTQENTLLKTAIPIAGPIFLRDPDTDWPIEMRTFTIKAGQLPVT
jgi:hypothetical protein